MAEGQDKVMLLAYLHLAARRSEVFNLSWSDVDFSASRIRLWTRKRKDGTREYDWLPMTAELRASLRQWWQERPVNDSPHVFVNLDQTPFVGKIYGKPFRYRQHFMAKVCIKALVKPFGFHAIRHLSASILYRLGYPVVFIQALLRHKSANTTERYLRTLGIEGIREGLEKAFKGPAEVIPMLSRKAEGFK